MNMKMKKAKRIMTILLTFALILTMLTGCSLIGKILKSAVGKEKPSEESVNTEPENEPDTDTKAQNESTKNPESTTDPETAEADGTVADPETGDEGEDGSSHALTLGEKLCGRYSFELSKDEFYTIEILDFNGNLYAHAGYAFDEHEEGMVKTLTDYSFYAMELLPEEADAFRRTDTTEAKVGIVGFSVMSNFGKYWGASAKGTIALSDDGIIFSGFENSEFFEEEMMGKVLTPDERAEEAFCYMNGEGAELGEEPEIAYGLFREKAPGSSVYICFLGNRNLLMYRKSPGEEVTLAGGNYFYDDGVIKCELSILGCGGQPSLFPIEISDRKEDSFELRAEDAEIFFGDGLYTFERIDSDEVPVVTVSDAEKAGIDEDYGLRKLYSEEVDENAPFYGVFAAAYKDRNTAYQYLEDYRDSCFDSSIIYSPDWEELNPEPYYCVALARCKTEEDAKEELARAKDFGYTDAYIRYSGKRTGKRVFYFLYSLSGVKVSEEEVVLKNVQVDDPSSVIYATTDLVIDKETVFDPSCDLSFFANYETGDDPLTWFLRNEEYSRTDPDRYMEHGPALIGEFEVGLTGKHIDRFYGCYWWD